MTVAEIKNAIECLSEKERCELNAWMQNWTPDEWDRQMQADVQSGKLDALAREGEESLRRGECRPFP
jgi:hypothetical protein